MLGNYGVVKWSSVQFGISIFINYSYHKLEEKEMVPRSAIELTRVEILHAHLSYPSRPLMSIINPHSS